MQPQARRPIMRTVLGVLGTAVAGVLLAPAPVHADCGDYVTIGHPAGHAAMTGHATTPAQTDSRPMPRDGRKPCSGPRCSGGTPAAPAPLAPTSAPRGEESGMASIPA